MDKLNELKTICLNNNIPIIRDDIVLFFNDFFKQEWISNVLEIGTAYGYSSYVIHNINKNIKITTIEKNKNNIEIANQYISDFAKVINTDVRDYQTDEVFDVIFFDGPKTCQIEMFENFKNNLHDNGIFLIDNIFLKGLLKKTNSTRVKKIIDKNNLFISYLKDLKDWKLEIYNIGDGLGVLKRCKN